MGPRGPLPDLAFLRDCLDRSTFTALVNLMLDETIAQLGVVFEAGARLRLEARRLELVAALDKAAG